MQTLQLQGYNNIFHVSYQYLQVQTVIFKIQINHQLIKSLDSLSNYRLFKIDDCISLAKQKVQSMINHSIKNYIFLIIFGISDIFQSKLVNKGIYSIVKRIAASNIYTNTHIVGIQYQIQIDHQNSVQNLFTYLKNINNSKVLHGTIFQLKKHQTSLNYNTKNQNQYILVSGGFRGIGKQTAIKLASKGKNLILTARSINKAQIQFKQQLQKIYKVKIQLFQLNLLQKLTFSKLSTQLLQRNITLKGVLHNAAVGTATSKHQANKQISFEEILLNVNTKGTIEFHQQLQNKQLINKNTIITIVSSVGSLRPFSQMNQIDQISKQMLDSWAQELSKTYNHVSIIYPGAVDTEMLQQSLLNKLGKKLQQFTKKMPKQMIIRPEVIGQLIQLTFNQQLYPYFKNLKINACCGLDLDFKSLPQVQRQSVKNLNLTQNSIKQTFKPLSQQNKSEWKLLAPVAAHFICQKDLFSQQNSQGYINFIFLINHLNLQNITRYLPKYIKGQHCQYTLSTNQRILNNILSKDSPYETTQTFSMNNLVTIIAIHAQVWSKVSFEGHYSQLETVQQFSECQFVPYQQSSCHILFYPSEETIRKYLELETDKKILIVVNGKYKVIKTDKLNIFYALQISYEYGFTCGVCYYKDQQVSKKFGFHFYNLQMSTFISATIQHLQNALSMEEKHQLEQLVSYQQYKQNFVQFLSQSSASKIKSQNIHFSIGGGAALSNLGRAIFNKKDRVLLDRPFFFAFFSNFAKSGIVFEHEDLFSGTLKEKAQNAYEKGMKGYLLVNPHNPTGKVYDPQQIYNLLEWAKQIPQFHIIIDQMYCNYIYDQSTKIFTGISYANQYPNVHIIRGFAKDFSLCGFKIGLLISSNPKVKQTFKRWQKIICNQTIVLKVVSRLVKQTKYGKLVFDKSRQILSKLNNLCTSLSKQNKINFIVPKGGCFMIIDLREVLKKSGMTEEQLWCKIFYQYKVTVARGKDQGFLEEGYYRICHTINPQAIQQGIKRLAMLCHQIRTSKE